MQPAVLLLVLKSPLCPSCQQLQCLPIACQWLGLVTRRIRVHRTMLMVLTSRSFFNHVVRRFVIVVLKWSVFVVGTASARFVSLLCDRTRRPEYVLRRGMLTILPDVSPVFLMRKPGI